MVFPLGVTTIDCAPPPITMGEPAVWLTVSTGVTAQAATVPDTTYPNDRARSAYPPTLSIISDMRA
jgi:hypothetical protein